MAEPDTEDRFEPFSNSSEWASWTARNCERCVREDDCEIAAALAFAAMDDGTINAEIARRMGYVGEGLPRWCEEFEGGGDTR